MKYRNFTDNYSLIFFLNAPSSTDVGDRQPHRQNLVSIYGFFAKCARIGPGFQILHPTYIGLPLPRLPSNLLLFKRDVQNMP